MINRIIKLKHKLAELNTSAMLLTNPYNMYYFSGFSGEGAVLITESEQHILTDSRYTEQAGRQAQGFHVVECSSGDFTTALAALSAGIGRIGFESDHMTCSQMEAIHKQIPQTQFISTEGIGKNIRAVKDRAELDFIKAASKVTDLAFQKALEFTEKGIREYELAAQLEYYMAREHNASKAFDFIVASGMNGSMPHALVSSKDIVQGDFVTLDFGAKKDYYNSDMTRTYAIGVPDPKLNEIYQIVLEAQMAAQDELMPGKRCADIDRTARDIITKAGYGEYFGHGLGHGVGLEIHELPVLNPRSQQILEPNMVVTVEPGIYIPGLGGVRIENTCVITEDSYEALFDSTRELIII